MPFDTKKKQKNRLMGAEAIWIDFSTFLIKCSLLEINCQTKKNTNLSNTKTYTTENSEYKLSKCCCFTVKDVEFMEHRVLSSVLVIRKSEFWYPGQGVEL